MTAGDVWLELAAQRSRIAALEATVERLVQIVSSEAALRTMRQQARRERVSDSKRGNIQALARFFYPANTEALARSIERVYAREIPPPVGSESLIEELRRAYGHGGPSRRTIRRALTELPNECVKSRDDENGGVTTIAERTTL